MASGRDYSWRERSGGTWEILGRPEAIPSPASMCLLGRASICCWNPGARLVYGSSDLNGAAKKLRHLRSWSGMVRLRCLPTSVTGAICRAIVLVIRRSTLKVPARIRWPPTAGLHFTDQVFSRLAARGITWVDLTLHVGLGTFRPLRVDRLGDHVLHAEWAQLSAQAITTLEARRQAGGRIVVVGTTAVRTLETAAADGTLRPFSGETQLFIKPGHTFRALDALITNFHLPRSSLLVLISTWAGLDLTRAAYAEAIRCRYRFFSYGDAMLIV